MYIVRDTDRGKYLFFKAKVIIFFFFKFEEHSLKTLGYQDGHRVYEMV